MSSRSSHRQSVLLIDNLLSDIQTTLSDVSNKDLSGNDILGLNRIMDAELMDPYRPIERPLVSHRSSLNHSNTSSRKNSASNCSRRSSHRQSIRDLDDLMVQLSLQSNAGNEDHVVQDSLSDRLNRRMSKLENLIHRPSTHSMGRVQGSLRPSLVEMTTSISASCISSQFSRRPSAAPSCTTESRLAGHLDALKTRSPSISPPQFLLKLHTDVGVYSMSISCSCTLKDALDLLNATIPSKLKLNGFEPLTHLTTWDQTLSFSLDAPLLLFMDICSCTTTSQLELKAFADQLQEDVLDAYTCDVTQLNGIDDPLTHYDSGDVVEIVAWRPEIQGFGWIRGTINQVLIPQKRVSIKTKEGHVHSVFDINRIRRLLSGSCKVYHKQVLLSAGTRVEYRIGSMWAAGIITGHSLQEPLVYTLEKVTCPEPLSDHGTEDVPVSPLNCAPPERSLKMRLRHWVNTCTMQQGVPAETVVVHPEDVRVGWSVGLADAITMNKI